MTDPATELDKIATNLIQARNELTSAVAIGSYAALRDAATDVGRSWSGSQIGYHALIYYDGFRIPPPGAHFSQEWGLMDAFSMGTRGEWRECQADVVEAEILKRAGNPDIVASRKAIAKALSALSSAQSEVRSILTVETSHDSDPFLSLKSKELEELRVWTDGDTLNHLVDRRQIITRDSTALGQGYVAAPHQRMLAVALALETSITALNEAAEVVLGIRNHLQRKHLRSTSPRRTGTHVFIGHGRSTVWRDLKDFISERLKLPYDEFNRVPVAGVTNIARLSQMLDSAALALIVMTAEDEALSGGFQARMNVIHEAGLFQGRLGFSKAIILLEEGCAEFSNIQGLGQIRFPAGNVKHAFEEIREVLEREGVLKTE
jgi:predicted nucleotide-binding protein